VFPFRGPPSTSGIETFRDGPFRDRRGAFRALSLGNDGWGRAGSPYNDVAHLVRDEGLLGEELSARLFHECRGNDYDVPQAFLAFHPVFVVNQVDGFVCVHSRRVTTLFSRRSHVFRQPSYVHGGVILAPIGQIGTQLALPAHGGRPS